MAISSRFRFAHWLALGALCAWWCSACAGHADGGSSSAGGSGDGGALSSAGSGSLLPPAEISDRPTTLGPGAVKCAGSPVVDAAMLRACVLVAGCAPQVQATALSECIARALPASGAFPECVIGAQGCAEMAACTGVGFYPDPCEPGQINSICVGAKAVRCSVLRARSFVDCAKRGASCVQFSQNDDGKLDGADCAVTPACSGAGDKAVCDGSRRVTCQHGIGFGEDCAKRGLTCVDQPDGAVCALASGGCTTPGAAVCTSDGKGTYCQADGQTLNLDCGRLGFTCQTQVDRPQGIDCANPTCPAADVAECFEACDGPLAHLCLGGQRLSIDCQDYGFHGCILDTRPGLGDRARCGDL